MLETEKNNNELKGIGMKGSFETYTIGDLCSSLNGLWKGKKEPFVNVGVIRNANFTKDFKLDYSNIEYIDVELRSFEKRNLQDGDLIIEKSGGSEKNPVGRAVLYEGESGKYSYSNFTSILRIKDKKQLSSKYLYNFILYRYKEGDMADMQSHSTGIHNLDYEKYLAIEIPVPSLTEQSRIVAQLDAAFAKIDALKENAQKGLQAVKDLWQATLKEELNPKEGWEMKTVDDIAIDIYRGSGITKDQVTEKGIPCVRYGEIYTKYNYSFNSCFSHTSEAEIKSKKYFEHGDILFAITGESIEDIAKCIAYTGDDKCLAGGDIVVLKHKQDPRFLSYALMTPDVVRQKGLGKVKLKVVHSSVPSIKSLRIPIAPIERQHEIAEKLDRVRMLIKGYEGYYNKELAEYDALKQSILRKAFSGEL